MRRVLPHKQTRARRVEWATLALAASRKLSSDGELEVSIFVKTAKYATAGKRFGSHEASAKRG